MTNPYYKEDRFELYHGDCNAILKNCTISPDVIFADPPYFLSGEGYTVQSGKIESVKKGDWDIPKSIHELDEFNYNWLNLAKNILSPKGSIWISGTIHNIPSIITQLNILGYKILNCVVWNKTNPPPNFTKRFFTHSAELIIWARKDIKKPHYFNYELMKLINNGKQMQDVWRLPSIAPWEKIQGKHPTQKPLSLLSRIILASTSKNDLILDPFCGSSTTGIAANIFGRNYVGIDLETNFLDISISRKQELSTKGTEYYINKMFGKESHILSKEH